MNNLCYPIYIISKGRADCCLTARALIKDKVPFRLVVEPQERDQYAAEFGADRLLILPFANLGQGGIPARNWVWEHSRSEGHARHWILDDNIRQFVRRRMALKLPCNANAAFATINDFVDRYDNIAIAGMNYAMFAPNNQKIVPFVRNVHVYSNLLIRNDLPFRWRGRYNEDTDLCLRVLSAGWCTVLFNAFLAEKMPTMKMKGGNSAELYKGDGRLKMARSLERAWPYVVETKRRFKRPQHVVRDAWAKFDTPLKRRTDIDWNAIESAGANEYGMKLTKTKPDVKSPALRELLGE
ncbi:MAG: hypothetical protein FWD53_06380 [Phycisphaerales bacterium]|nr:hypothetical protein [Phycisphaerales bacterium]